MRTVTIRLSGEDFSTAIVGMRDWLEKHRCEPISYRYDQNDETVVMSVDFADHLQAKAFAKRFGGKTGDKLRSPVNGHAASSAGPAKTASGITPLQDPNSLHRDPAVDGV